MIATTSQPTQMSKTTTCKHSAFYTTTSQQEELNAFNELVLAHQDSVYRQALWILGDEDAAEDAAQEAFLRAYRNFHTYDGGPFRPWIMRITTNYCLDQLRRRKIRKTTSLEAYDEYEEEIENAPWLRDPTASVEETLMRSEQQKWLMDCIYHLPVDYRAAITLVDLQEMDYAEAASALGIPLGTFKSRLSRARMLLQKLIKSNPVSLPVAI
jgi:RNA polymerase sigma-70 factor (ECF subfamily)